MGQFNLKRKNEMKRNRYKGSCTNCGTIVQSGRGYLHSYKSGRRKRFFVTCIACSEEIESESCHIGNDDDHAAAMHAVKNIPGTLYIPSSGFVGFRNPAGRCEDAPCCGCCTY